MLENHCFRSTLFMKKQPRNYFSFFSYCNEYIPQELKRLRISLDGTVVSCESLSCISVRQERKSLAGSRRDIAVRQGARLTEPSAC